MLDLRPQIPFYVECVDALPQFSDCNKAPTNPSPAWGINTSSVVEMMNCMMLLSLTFRVNHFAVSSSPFCPQEQALFHTQRQKTVTDSGNWQRPD
jgi:hypothetical protein